MKPNEKHKQTVQAILKGKAKPRRKADYDWINFANAVGEIAKALSLPSEIAQATLFGLIATGEIRASDRTDLIDLDECTIAEIQGRAAFVVAGELREWLRDHSTAPSANIRDAEIRKRLPRRMNWKDFGNEIRDACPGGWIGKHRPGMGFSLKQIQRRVKELERL